MRKLLIPAAVLLMAAAGCNSKADTPQSIAQHWCDLNGRVAKAETPDQKDAAREARRNYEKEIEKRYEKDQKTMDEIKRLAEACESQSERRNE